VTDQAEAVRH